MLVAAAEGNSALGADAASPALLGSRSLFGDAEADAAAALADKVTGTADVLLCTELSESFLMRLVAARSACRAWSSEAGLVTTKPAPNRNAVGDPERPLTIAMAGVSGTATAT